MAIISELYFRLNHTAYDSYKPRIVAKAKEFVNIGAEVSEFGTRRRYSFGSAGYHGWHTKGAHGQLLNGTSNVYLAMKYGLTPWELIRTSGLCTMERTLDTAWPIPLHLIIG